MKKIIAYQRDRCKTITNNEKIIMKCKCGYDVCNSCTKDNLEICIQCGTSYRDLLNTHYCAYYEKIINDVTKEELDCDMNCGSCGSIKINT